MRRKRTSCCAVLIADWAITYLLPNLNLNLNLNLNPDRSPKLIPDRSAKLNQEAKLFGRTFRPAGVPVSKLAWTPVSRKFV